MKQIQKITTAALLLCSLHAGAQSKHVKNLIKDLTDKPGYQHIPLDTKTLMQSVGDQTDTADKQEITDALKGISNMEIITTDSLKDQLYAKALAAITADHYIEMITVNDKEDHVKIYADKKGDNAKNMLVLVKDGDNCVLLSLSGQLKESLVKEMLSKVQFNQTGKEDQED